mmetsp:Transcript_11732/g.21250  ORF Transcript_11732/g.21250 Transcript_11732/m.21250 type:complete len:90 (+) Transcript_11732:119-388(+)
MVLFGSRSMVLYGNGNKIVRGYSSSTNKLPFEKPLAVPRGVQFTKDKFNYLERVRVLVDLFIVSSTIGMGYSAFYRRYYQIDNYDEKIY